MDYRGTFIFGFRTPTTRDAVSLGVSRMVSFLTTPTKECVYVRRLDRFVRSLRASFREIAAADEIRADLGSRRALVLLLFWLLLFDCYAFGGYSVYSCPRVVGAPPSTPSAEIVHDESLALALFEIRPSNPGCFLCFFLRFRGALLGHRRNSFCDLIFAVLV